MGSFCNNTEILQVREGYYPFRGSITGAWGRLVEVNVAEVRSRLEKVEQLAQKDLVLMNFTMVKRCEVRQVPPGQGCVYTGQGEFAQR